MWETFNTVVDGCLIIRNLYNVVKKPAAQCAGCGINNLRREKMRADDTHTHTQQWKTGLQLWRNHDATNRGICRGLPPT